jgi:hypothetical protein
MLFFFGGGARPYLKNRTKWAHQEGVVLFSCDFENEKDHVLRTELNRPIVLKSMKHGHCYNAIETCLHM